MWVRGAGGENPCRKAEAGLVEGEHAAHRGMGVPEAGAAPASFLPEHIPSLGLVLFLMRCCPN